MVGQLLEFELMTRLRKHLQKLKPADLAELVTLAPAVKARAQKTDPFVETLVIAEAHRPS